MHMMNSLWRVTVGGQETEKDRREINYCRSDVSKKKKKDGIEEKGVIPLKPELNSCPTIAPFSF